MGRPRYMEIAFTKRQVRCISRLLDEKAPRTCELVWSALPQEGLAFHAKYANNEVYTLVPVFSDQQPGLEHHTLMPIPGDIVYFYIRPDAAKPRQAMHLDPHGKGLVDLAIFYGRNNFVFSPTEGPMPGNVFATVVHGLEEMAEACQSVWYEGAVGERLVYRRLEPGEARVLGLPEA